MPVSNLYDIKKNFDDIAKDDQTAFAATFEYYKKRVFTLALRMLKSPVEAEEIVQQVFLSLWQARCRLKDIEQPESYLFNITYNAVYAQLKKISRDRRRLDEIVLRLVDIQNSTQEKIAANETSKLIHQAIQQLPPKKRSIYELNKQLGLDYQQIATRMGISKNTVRNQIADATRSVRLFMREHVLSFLGGLIFLSQCFG